MRPYQNHSVRQFHYSFCLFVLAAGLSGGCAAPRAPGHRLVLRNPPASATPESRALAATPQYGNPANGVTVPPPAPVERPAPPPGKASGAAGLVATLSPASESQIPTNPGAAPEVHSHLVGFPKLKRPPPVDTAAHPAEPTVTANAPTRDTGKSMPHGGMVDGSLMVTNAGATPRAAVSPAPTVKGAVGFTSTKIRDPEPPSALQPAMGRARSAPPWGHARDYRWVRGVLVRVNSRGGFWQIRFASHDQENPYGGRFVLADPIPSKFKEGDWVKLIGKIGQHNDRCGATSYQVDRFECISSPNDSSTP